MSIPSKQIGQSAESNLLWQISKQLEWINNNTGYNTGTFVPYVGATSAVNLGTQTLYAGYVELGPNRMITAPYDYTAVDVLGRSILRGLGSTNGAASSEELVGSLTGSGTGWTGTDFANGYTHTTPGSNIALTSPSIVPVNAVYSMYWTITNRTQGSIRIRFGDMLDYNITTDGSRSFFNSNNSTPFSIDSQDGFNGTVAISLYKIISYTQPILSFTDSTTQVVNEIRALGGYNFAMGFGSGAFILSETYGSNYLSGHYAGNFMTTGMNNTCIGNGAGSYINSGTNNIAIGYNSGNYSGGANNTIAIGTTCEGDDIIKIGGNVSTISIGAVNQGSIYSTTIGNSNITSTIIYGNLLLGGTVNRNAILDVTGPSLQNGNRFFAQPTPTAKIAVVAATLTIAELLTGIISVSNNVAVTLTLPTGSLTDAGILNGLLPVNNAFDWVVINVGTVLGIVTIAAGGASHSVFGLRTIPIASQATFRTRKTGTNIYTTYRIA